jgi:hypothetical protein
MGYTSWHLTTPFEANLIKGKTPIECVGIKYATARSDEAQHQVFETKDYFFTGKKQYMEINQTSLPLPNWAEDTEFNFRPLKPDATIAFEVEKDVQTLHPHAAGITAEKLRDKLGLILTPKIQVKALVTMELLSFPYEPRLNPEYSTHLRVQTEDSDGNESSCLVSTLIPLPSDSDDEESNPTGRLRWLTYSMSGDSPEGPSNYTRLIDDPAKRRELDACRIYYPYLMGKFSELEAYASLRDGAQSVTWAPDSVTFIRNFEVPGLELAVQD